MATTLFNFGTVRPQTRTPDHAMGFRQPRRHSSCAACLWLMLTLVLPGAVQAQFSYTTNNGAITLTSYSGAGDVVVISNFVTSIGDSAFVCCFSLTNVTIPNSVTSIGDSAFYSCSSLTSVTIPDSVTNIGAYAFACCFSLTSVTIPDSVTNIGDYAFDECWSLTSVTIPDNVTNIGNSAFAYCYSLTSVTIPNSVTNIGAWAFSCCCSLTNVTIPNSVTYIGNFALAACSNLMEIKVDSNNPAYSSAGGVLFDKSQNLLVCFPGGKTGSFVIPDSVTSIGDAAFYECYSVTNVTVPDSVTSIGDNAFYCCPSLTSVTIPDSVTNIGDSAFDYCYGLTAVYFAGNAPLLESSAIFYLDSWATVYYLPGTTNWGSTFAGRPTSLWDPVVQTSAPSFGVQTNRFGFTITGTANIPILIEGCTNLAEGVWVPRESLSLTNGSYYFSDAEWANYPNCFYRIRSP